MAEETKSTSDEAQAFLNSEREYVENGLRVGYETFLNRLEIHNKVKPTQSIISDDDILKIFSNYRTLYNANSKLFDDLMLLRLEGKEKLRDNLGKCMVDFIPYFRMYTDYIVKKQAAITHLDKVKKSNKKFRQFLKINEMCAGRKLKSFLEEPAARLPQYLQHLAGVYVAYEHEHETSKDSEGGRLLLQAIVDIKKVTDEIAVKCRDLKARLLVGALQKDVFGNKIQLLSAHRYCVSHSSMNMVVTDKNDKLKIHKFILCNDILVISSLATAFKSGQLVSVFPLIGLRVLRDPKVSEQLTQSTDEEKLKHRFALVPQNKNFGPSDSSNSYIGSIIIVCDNEKQLEKWIETIEDTVDEEEHNLKPCNPVDLEKRLRKQKLSKEGEAETITITDPEKIKEIEIWKEAKANGVPLKKIKSQRSSSNQAPSTPTPDPSGSDDQKQQPPQANKNNLNATVTSRPPSRAPPTRMSMSARPPPKPKPKGPPPRRNTTHRRQPSGPPKKPVPSPKSSVASEPPSPSLPSMSAASSAPPKAAPAVPSKPLSKFAKKTPSAPTAEPLKEDQETEVIKRSNTVPLNAEPTKKKPPMHKKNNSRMNMLASIQSFKKSSTLKHVDAETLKKEAAARPENVTNLLQSTLKNYRQFVMDDDDSDDDSDADWND